MITEADKKRVMRLMDSMIAESCEFDPKLAGAEYLDKCSQFNEIFEVICEGLMKTKYEIFETNRGFGVECMKSGKVSSFPKIEQAKAYVSERSK